MLSLLQLILIVLPLTLLMITLPETPLVLKLWILKELFRVFPLSIAVEYAEMECITLMLLQCAQKTVKTINNPQS